jgi:transposase
LVRGLLSDDEWAFLEPFVMERGALRGRRPADHCRTLNTVSWIARTGAPWRDVPEEFGNWNSVHRQYRRWTAAGPWDLMLGALAEGGGSNAVQMVDSTVIRAHHCAAGARGGTQNQALGRSRGGFSTKIHARTNAEGLPIALILTPSEAHDSTAFNDLMA